MEIYHAYPSTLQHQERNGLTPRQLLAEYTPNAPNYTREEFLAVRQYLDGLEEVHNQISSD